MIRAVTVALVLGLSGLAPTAALAASPADISAATPTACTVDDAAITWGFKESFRSYISGSIANGKWTVADGATYATPDFGFSGGSGSLDAGKGTIAFPGSIEFTGHGGILDTIVANPRLVFDGSSSATLLLDVVGTTQQGAAIDTKAVPFATVDLATATRTESTFTVAAAKTVLTAEGATAFGTYEAGTELDPIKLTLRSDAACLPLPSRGAAIAIVAVLFGAVVGLAVLTAVIVVIVLARRARKKQSKT